MANPRNWRYDDSSGRPVTRFGRATGQVIDALPNAIEIDPERTAVVLIDLQNDFCHPEGWLAGIGVDVSVVGGILSAVNELSSFARAADMPVIWVNWGNREDRANLPPNVIHVYDPDGRSAGIGSAGGVNGRSEAVLTKNSWGAAIVSGLTVESQDVRVDKYRMSGFFDTPLDAILRRLDVTTLLFGGVNADQCVLATLTDAACLGYDCLLVEDATATTSPEYCLQATLYNTRQCFGFTTTTAALKTSTNQHREKEKSWDTNRSSSTSRS